MPTGVAHDVFLERLRRTRRELEALGQRAPRARHAARLLQRIERVLSEPLRVLLLGEVNAGKTTLVNRIVGADVLDTDVIGNSRRPVLVRHAARPRVGALLSSGRRVPILKDMLDDIRRDPGARIEVGIPSEALLAREIADTPGIVPGTTPPAWLRPLRQAGAIAVWCTVAAQAWRASEVACWSSLRLGAPTSLLAVTHADLVPAADRDKIRQRLERDAGPLFRDIVMVGTDEAALPLASFLATLESTLDAARTHQRQRALEIVEHHLAALPSETRASVPELAAAAAN